MGQPGGIPDEPHAPALRGLLPSVVPRVQVAMLGAGNMGGAMVARLAALGWSVVVCDIDPVRQQQALAHGAALAASPREAAQALLPDGVVIVCVVDAEQAHSVLFGERGAVAALGPGQAVMLCPTIAPQDTETLAADLQRCGIGCIDAPMSGGPARARDGSMSLMLAGPDALLAHHEPLLAALSNQRFRISNRVGDGARTKLVNNLLAGINLVGAAEALALAERLGLDLATTLSVIEQSSGQSWIGSDRMRRALAGDKLPRAQVGLLAKDTRLALAAARQAGFAGPLGESAASVFEQAAGRDPQADDAVLLQHLREP